jgi:hypothetical protein
MNNMQISYKQGKKAIKGIVGRHLILSDCGNYQACYMVNEQGELTRSNWIYYEDGTKEFTNQYGNKI